MCSSGEHGFDIHPTGGFWIRAMVTGAGAMVDGIGHWYWIEAMVTGSMDDGLVLWITGDWWMMLALPSWYCVCSRNCDIPPGPLLLPN